MASRKTQLHQAQMEANMHFYLHYQFRSTVAQNLLSMGFICAVWMDLLGIHVVTKHV